MTVVSVLSGKGGVGKTTTSSNLAVALTNEFKRRVIVMDTNISASHIKLHFGMYNGLKKTLPDIIRENSEISKATYFNDTTGVYIIPSSAGLDRNVDLGNLEKIAWELANSNYDFVIIDSAPGFGDDVMNAIKAADIVLIVTTANIPDVSDALKIVELVNKSKKKIWIVLNKVTNRRYELEAREIEKMLGNRIVAIIHEDKKVPESIACGVPVVIYSGNSKASIALKKLAGFLLGEEYKPSIADRMKWFFGY